MRQCGYGLRVLKLPANKTPTSTSRAGAATGSADQIAKGEEVGPQPKVPARAPGLAGAEHKSAVGDVASKGLAKPKVSAVYEKVRSAVPGARLLNRAFEMDKIGKPEAALELYAEAGASLPAFDERGSKTAALHQILGNRTGLALTHLGRFDEAERSLRSALSMQDDPFDREPYAPAHYNMACLELKRGGEGGEGRAMVHLEIAVLVDSDFFAPLARKDPDLADLAGAGSAFNKLTDGGSKLKYSEVEDRLSELKLQAAPRLPAGMASSNELSGKIGKLVIQAGASSDEIQRPLWSAQSLIGRATAADIKQLESALQALPEVNIPERAQAEAGGVLRLGLARAREQGVAQAIDQFTGRGPHWQNHTIGEGGYSSREHGLHEGFDYDRFQTLRAAFAQTLDAGPDAAGLEDLTIQWEGFKSHVQAACDDPWLRPDRDGEPSEFSDLQYEARFATLHSATVYSIGSDRLQRDIAAIDASLEKGERTFELDVALPNLPTIKGSGTLAKAGRVPFAKDGRPADFEALAGALRSAFDQTFTLTAKAGATKGVEWTGPKTGGAAPSADFQLSAKGLEGAADQDRDALDALIAVGLQMGMENGKRGLYSDKNLNPVRKGLDKAYGSLRDMSGSSKWGREDSLKAAIERLETAISDLGALQDPTQISLETEAVAPTQANAKGELQWPLGREPAAYSDLAVPLTAAIRGAYDLKRNDPNEGVVWSGPAGTPAKGLPRGAIKDQLSAKAFANGDPLKALVATTLQIGMEQGARVALDKNALDLKVIQLPLQVTLGQLKNAPKPLDARVAVQDASWQTYELIPVDTKQFND